MKQNCSCFHNRKNLQRGTIEKLIKLCSNKIVKLSKFFLVIFSLEFYGSKNSILNWFLKLNLFKFLQVFFLFILLHHCFYSISHKYIQNKQALTNRFLVPWKILCTAFRKQTKQNNNNNNNKKEKKGAFVLFLFLCVLLSCYWLTVLLDNKDKNPGNEEV